MKRDDFLKKISEMDSNEVENLMYRMWGDNDYCVFANTVEGEVRGDMWNIAQCVSDEWDIDDEEDLERAKSFLSDYFYGEALYNRDDNYVDTWYNFTDKFIENYGK